MAARFNSFRQLGGPEARELRDSILGAFYARYPEVQKAVNYDSASFGELTEKTRKMVRQALDRDAGMHGALKEENEAVNDYVKDDGQFGVGA